MPIYLGNEKIDSIYVWEDKIKKIYVGSELVYEEKPKVQIYGAYWDGSSSQNWTRTDDAAGFPQPTSYVAGAASYSSPFDNVMPWAGMVKTERIAGTMVAIPKFWYKLEQVGDGLKIQIASGPVEGFSPSPAHMDRGDGKGERDVVYIGRYHCGSDFKSTTGQLPLNNATKSEFKIGVQNLGENIFVTDFVSRFTIWLLYIVEFASWNSQSRIGFGCGDGSSNGVANMGYTDTMPYHTGTMQSSKFTYGFGTQYRNIEGLWDNVLDILDGCSYASSGFFIRLHANIGSSINVGTPSNGYVGGFAVTDVAGFPMFYPNKYGSSSVTGDTWTYNGSKNVIVTGASYNSSVSQGLFYIDCIEYSTKGAQYGCRIMELP